MSCGLEHGCWVRNVLDHGGLDAMCLRAGKKMPVVRGNKSLLEANGGRLSIVAIGLQESLRRAPSPLAPCRNVESSAPFYFLLLSIKPCGYKC